LFNPISLAGHGPDMLLNINLSACRPFKKLTFASPFGKFVLINYVPVLTINSGGTAMKSMLKLSILLLALAVPAIMSGQHGLPGSWKYVSQYGDMTMQINATTILINIRGQSQC
jgi:hypothetical protein